MHALIDLSWRGYPAAVLMALGAALALRGLRTELEGMKRPARDPAKALTVMRGFRLAVVGLALVGLGAAWAWQLAWLLALSLAIGGEETLESSIAIFALRRGRRLTARPAGEGRVHA